MGLGIQEPRGTRDTVTGTIIMTRTPQEVRLNPDLKDDTSDNNIGVRPRLSSATLKTTKDGIILNPQPHDNPNDPLNLPLWRRDMALLVIGFHSFIGGGQTPILAAGLSGLATEFHKSPTTVLYLVGGFMLLLGFGSLFASPTAILYGKRIVYLFGCLVAFGGAIWGACAKSFGSMMGARVLIGLGMSPTESLPSLTIAEIYFAHERAYRLGIYTFLLLGGKNLVPLLSGFVFQNLDRHWLFWILTIILGINFGLIFLFAPETFWNRTPTPPDKRSQEETAAARDYKLAHINSNDSQRSIPNSFALRGLNSDDRNSNNDILSQVETLNSSILSQQLIVTLPQLMAQENVLLEPNEPDLKRKPYVQTLKVTSGRHTSDKWWMVFLRPMVLAFYPAIAFGALMYTFAIVWLIMISEAMSHIFTRAPYGYTPAITGLFYVSPFIGSSIGSVIAGRMSDILVRRLVDRNNGIYEPEFRLIMVIPVFLSVTIGLMGFGWSLENADMWIVPVVFFGIIGFGCSLASTTLITFTVDSYKIFATELLVTLNLAKNVVGFLFSLFNNSFIDNHGARTLFLTYGGIQIFICLWAIPIYFYGKRLRAWTDDKEMIRFLYVDPHHEHHNDFDKTNHKTNATFDSEK